MNRALVCTMTAAIALIAGQATADVGLSLNLRYNDPADPSEGGTWELVVKSTAGEDVAGVLAVLGNIDDPTGNLTDPSGSHDINGSDPNVFAEGAGIFQVGYAQDFVSPTLGVGDGTSATTDDILNNGAWDGYTRIVSGGTFSGSRPEFDPIGAQEATEINVFDAGAATASAGTFATIDSVLSPTVRGDSVSIDGLLEGDANRSGTVDGDDFTILSLNFNDPLGGWDEGDFNDLAGVNGDDFTLLSINFNASSTPPAIGAVPEPTSVALVGLAAAGLLGLRRRNG